MRPRECALIARALVIGVALVALAACDDDRDPAAAPPPAPTSTPAPPTPTLAAWFDSLPVGDPPAAPYLRNGVLHLPGGDRVPIDGTDFEVMDATPRGTMLLVERKGAAFDTDYVWVEPDGSRTVLADTRSYGVQDAVVSPDGRWFARGGEVVSLVDGSVLARIPREATIVTGWTRHGVVYGTRDNRVVVWPPGGGVAFGQRDWTWFPNRTGAALEQHGGCWRVVVVHSYDDQTDFPRRCGGARPLTVSPGGRWVVDHELRVVDVRQGGTRLLAGAPLRSDSRNAYWESARVVLIGLDVGVLRCDVRDGDCEWALEHRAELPLR